MITRMLTAIVGAGCLGGAFALTPPDGAQWREPLRWLLRPAVLPFAWRDLEDAIRTGNAAESFARAQRILRLLPGWTDGQIVFSYRFVTGGGDAHATPATRAEHAWRRLQAALAWLEAARATAGNREGELLQAMAMLPEGAQAQWPGLGPWLRQDGGATAIADRYLAEAERVTASPAIREQRTFLTARLAAGLLAIGDRNGAIALLENGISRSADLRDRALATEWATRLRECIRHLRGEKTDLTALKADRRMSPLLPYLR